MTTQNISEKTVLQIMQREQERERRRIRDRQRRQSMSLEDREKHLARRRRNYQLRRQKADNSQLDSQCEQTSAMAGGDYNTMNESQAEIAAPELGVQSEGITHVSLNRGQDKLDVSSIKFEGSLLPCYYAFLYFIIIFKKVGLPVIMLLLCESKHIVTISF